MNDLNTKCGKNFNTRWQIVPHFIQVIGDLILLALSPPKDIIPPRVDQIIH